MTENQIFELFDTTQTPLCSQSNPPHRILVVEDDAAIRRLNAEMLLSCGYEVDVAADGAAGWEALQLDNYDLLVTDNGMPKLTGVELLKKLHAARLDMPVIMATGKMPQAEFDRQPWLQPAATLVKPYTMEEMCRTVKKVLREAESPATGEQPVASPARMDPGSSPSSESAGASQPDRTKCSQHILVVDGDRDLCQLYTEVLTGRGYCVDTVADGAAGWSALLTAPYDLLITEHDLPRLTGVELVRKMRAVHMALPVVMAAGRVPTGVLARNPWLQFAATLAKPFTIDALLDTVKNVLRSPDLPADKIVPLPTWTNQPSAGGLRR